MNPREVYGMLKEHHEKTGRIMAERVEYRCYVAGPGDSRYLGITKGEERRNAK